MYRDGSYKLYKDVTLETPFNATLGETTIQVEANPTNTITISTTDYIKLTASTEDVGDTDDKGLVINPDNILCELEDGVPTTTNVTITDVGGDSDSDSDSDTDSDSDSDTDTDTDSDSDSDTDTDTDSDTPGN